jgi:hypothetical protein
MVLVAYVFLRTAVPHILRVKWTPTCKLVGTIDDSSRGNWQKYARRWNKKNLNDIYYIYIDATH